MPATLDENTAHLAIVVGIDEKPRHDLQHNRGVSPPGGIRKQLLERRVGAIKKIAQPHMRKDRHFLSCHRDGADTGAMMNIPLGLKREVPAGETGQIGNQSLGGDHMGLHTDMVHELAHCRARSKTHLPRHLAELLWNRLGHRLFHHCLRATIARHDIYLPVVFAGDPQGLHAAFSLR